MMTAKISEIFSSIQGEGKYAGVRQVFVRFYACNMRCVWCDTPGALGDAGGIYQEMEVEEVFSRINSLGANCHSISLTGGEPLLQTDFIEALLPLLKKVRFRTFLETNGVLYKQLGRVIDGIDIIAMDIKLPSSTKDRAYWEEQEQFLKIAVGKEVFIKMIISTQTVKADVLKAMDLVAGISRDIPVYLQPNYYDMENGVVGQCLDYQQLCLTRLHDVRVLPQTHKWMNVR